MQKFAFLLVCGLTSQVVGTGDYHRIYTEKHSEKQDMDLDAKTLIAIIVGTYLLCHVCNLLMKAQGDQHLCDFLGTQKEQSRQMKRKAMA